MNESVYNQKDQYVGGQQTNINNSQGGAFSGNIQNLNYYSIDIRKVIEDLKAILPAGDSTGDHLVENFRTLHALVERLEEWKEAHNHLTNVLTDADPLYFCVRQHAEVLIIKRQWKQIYNRVVIFTDWAHHIKAVGAPFIEINGILQGEPWIIDVRAKTTFIHQIITSAEGCSQFDYLLELLGEFDDILKRHLYWVDHQLLTTSKNLVEVSGVVFRGL